MTFLPLYRVRSGLLDERRNYTMTEERGAPHDSAAANAAIASCGRRDSVTTP
jgi:hypothetical protein